MRYLELATELLHQRVAVQHHAGANLLSHACQSAQVVLYHNTTEGKCAVGDELDTVLVCALLMLGTYRYYVICKRCVALGMKRFQNGNAACNGTNQA